MNNDNLQFPQKLRIITNKKAPRSRERLRYPSKKDFPAKLMLLIVTSNAGICVV